MAAISPPGFDAFYSKYTPFVRRILAQRGVSAPDLDDVTQETFVAVYRLLPGFEGRSSLETWLHAVAWRVAANHRRRARMRVTRSLPSALDADSEADPEPSLAVDRYRASFDWIDDDDRDLLALRDIGGLSISSLAELTGNARATIRRKLEAGRAALERVLYRGGPTRERVAWLESVAARFEDALEIVPPPFMHVLPDGLTCLSTIDDVVLAVWRGPSSNESLQLLMETFFAHVRAWPNGFRYFALVESTSSPPTREGREMTAWVARKLGKNVTAVATTVEGTLMPLVASVMNASYFLARAPFDVRYFGELQLAAEWLAQFGPLDVARTIEHLENMRQRLGPPKGR